jgi:diketogulonate reductase-like aldo/keto reductase/gamma-glutamylcyclotransferase (GGCT)/AIG2-like uncharacterized protein YtfP
MGDERDTARIFVYGTLRRGGSNHGVVADLLRAIRPAVVHGFTLFDGPSFPGARPADGKRVEGELLVLAPGDVALRRLDALEGVLYERISVEARGESGTATAWMYVLAEHPGEGWVPCGERWSDEDPARREECMERRPFGPGQQRVPVVGQGTWNMEQNDRDATIAALRLGLDRGMTHVDTAELYGSGIVEEIVGEAIRGRRDEVFLVSKVMPRNASRKGTIAACERSLARLGTDHLDVYLLHWRGPHPLADTLAAMTELERAGKILSFGVSNFDVDDLEAALAITGEGRIACNQVLYHLEERAIEHAVLPWCEAHGVALVGYSPFGSGRFPGPATPAGRVLAEVAAAHGATPRQVALRFLLRRPALFTIPKASRAEHVEENARAGDLRLTQADLARLGDAFPLGPRPGTLPTI